MLFVAALFIGFAAFLNATVSVPHLREDMLEIHVRPTLLSAVLLGLHFGTLAMFAFAIVVFVSALQSLRDSSMARLPLSIIGLTYLAFGIVAFIWTRSYHTLGYVFGGVLLFGAILIPDRG
jgi:hypothetical protein